jgi:hypothetical protein
VETSKIKLGLILSTVWSGESSAELKKVGRGVGKKRDYQGLGFKMSKKKIDPTSVLSIPHQSLN